MRYLLIPLLAWALAQGSKHIFHLMGRNRRVFNKNPRSSLLLSGGMPSAHAATMVALAATIGLYDEVDTLQFENRYDFFAVFIPGFPKAKGRIFLIPMLT